MTKKPLIISCIATALSGLSKILSGKLGAFITSASSKIAGTAPTSPGKTLNIFAYIKYGIDYAGHALRNGASAVLTAPLKAINWLLTILGKLFIPLVIITIVLIVIMILMAFIKKRSINKKIQRAADISRNVGVAHETNENNIGYGSIASIFNRLR